MRMPPQHQQRHQQQQQRIITESPRAVCDFFPETSASAKTQDVNHDGFGVVELPLQCRSPSPSTPADRIAVTSAHSPQEQPRRRKLMRRKFSPGHKEDIHQMRLELHEGHQAELDRLKAQLSKFEDEEQKLRSKVSDLNETQKPAAVQEMVGKLELQMITQKHREQIEATEQKWESAKAELANAKARHTTAMEMLQATCQWHIQDKLEQQQRNDELKEHHKRMMDQQLLRSREESMQMLQQVESEHQSAVVELRETFQTNEGQLLDQLETVLLERHNLEHQMALMRIWISLDQDQLEMTGQLLQSLRIDLQDAHADHENSKAAEQEARKTIHSLKETMTVQIGELEEQARLHLEERKKLEEECQYLNTVCEDLTVKLSKTQDELHDSEHKTRQVLEEQQQKHESELTTLEKTHRSTVKGIKKDYRKQVTTVLQQRDALHAMQVDDLMKKTAPTSAKSADKQVSELRESLDMKLAENASQADRIHKVTAELTKAITGLADDEKKKSVTLTKQLEKELDSTKKHHVREIELHATKIKQTEEILSAANQRHEQLQEEHEDLKEKLTKAKTTVEGQFDTKRLKKKVAVVSALAATRKRDLEKLQKKVTEEKSAKTVAWKDQVTNLKKELEDKLKAAEDERERRIAEEKAQHCESIVLIKEEHKEQLGKVVKQLQEQELRTRRLETENSSLKHLEKMVDEQKKEFEMKSRDLQKKSAQELSDLQSNHQTELRTAEKEHSQLVGAMDQTLLEKRNAWSAFRTEFDCLRSTLTDVQSSAADEATRAKSNYGKLLEKNKSLEKQIQESKLELNSRTKEVETAEAALSTQKHKHKHQMSEAERNHKEFMKKMSTKLQDVLSANAELLECNEKLRKQIVEVELAAKKAEEESQARYACLAEEKKHLTLDVAVLKVDKEQMKSEFECRIAAMREDMDRTRTKFKSCLEESRSALLASAQSSEKEKKDADRNLADARLEHKRELSNVEQKHENNFNRLTLSIREHETNMAALTSKMSDMNKQYLALQIENDALSERVSELQASAERAWSQAKSNAGREQEKKTLLEELEAMALWS